MRLVYTDAAYAYALFRDGEGKRRRERIVGKERTV
jgi:hypothetical protein